jgi:hypothetical protein
MKGAFMTQDDFDDLFEWEMGNDLLEEGIDFRDGWGDFDRDSSAIDGWAEGQSDEA